MAFLQSSDLQSLPCPSPPSPSLTHPPHFLCEFTTISTSRSSSLLFISVSLSHILISFLQEISLDRNHYFTAPSCGHTWLLGTHCVNVLHFYSFSRTCWPVTDMWLMTCLVVRLQDLFLSSSIIIFPSIFLLHVAFTFSPPASIDLLASCTHLPPSHCVFLIPPQPIRLFLTLPQSISLSLRLCLLLLLLSRSLLSPLLAGGINRTHNKVLINL